MKKQLEKIIGLLAVGVATFFACLFIRDRIEYGSSYKRPGRWY